MVDEFVSYFQNLNFMPHGHCFFWRKDLLFIHVGSDVVIALAYYTIPVALWYLTKRRKDLAFNWMFILFGLFILACGTTHLLSIWNIWYANYYIEGVAKLLTALVSIATAILVWPLIPRIMALPSPQQLATTNAELHHEISRREKTEHELRLATEELKKSSLALEETVDLRTRELQQAKRELELENENRRAAERRIRNLLEVVPNGILMINDQGNIELSNSQIEALFGYSEEELVGKPIETLVPTGVRERHVAIRNRYLKQASEMHQGLLTNIEGEHKNGSLFPVTIGLNPLVQQNQTFVVAAITDLTPIREVQAKLVLRNEALKRSNQELEQFAFIASHDLREPLRKIMSFGNLIATGDYGKLTEEGGTFFDYMQDAAKRMMALLDSLLNYSRVTSRAQPFLRVSLDNIIDQVIDDLELKIKDKDATVIRDALPEIEADPAQVRQLFQNLIENSLKYACDERKPEIRIRCVYTSGNLCKLSVSDNGIGFDDQYKHKIFEVFQRLHGHSEYSGTGMGLSICRKIVDRHSGDISAEGKVGQGACIYVELPIHQDIACDETQDTHHTDGG